MLNRFVQCSKSGFLLIDKPVGLTSRHCLKKIQNKVGIKKAGLEGILDPFASGMLILMFGHATRFVPWLHTCKKSYKARLSLGIATDSYDSYGKVTKQSNKPLTLKINQLEKVLKEFKGRNLQKPPLFSNVRINGKRLREIALDKKNDAIDIPEREVEVYNIELMDSNLESDSPWLEFYVSVSAGTYIRSLGVEIAKKLGLPGHLNQLRRTSIGVFNKMTSMESILNSKHIDLLPIDKLLSFLPKKILSVKEANFISQGKPLFLENHSESLDIRLYNHESTFLGIGRLRGKELRVARLLPTS